MFEKNAVIYCRSTKNRHGCSIAQQIASLHEYAEQRGLKIIAQFIDDTVSGLQSNRPGINNLLQALRDPNRIWQTILIYDTSRLSRDNQLHFQTLFEIECEKYDVVISYKTIPDSDPITQKLIKSMLSATDAWFSMQSRVKGMDAMEANARECYWVGGRAPFGYDLKEITVQKLGKTVTKKRLVLNKDSAKMKEFLTRLAAGEKGAIVAKELGISNSRTTVNAWKWQALTYAGCLVWNKTNAREPGKGKYKKGGKYRDRSEWIVTETCHEALITRAQAETLLKQLDEGKRNVKSDFLLSGLLKSPDGRTWHGNSDNRHIPHQRSYRLKTEVGYKKIDKAAIEGPVINQVLKDLSNPCFVDTLLEAHKTSQKKTDNEGKLRANKQKITSIITKQGKLVDLLLEQNELKKAIMPRLNVLRKELEMLERQNKDLERVSLNQVNLSKPLIRKSLESLADQKIPTILDELIDYISLNPLTFDCVIHYKLRIEDSNRAIDASPRGVEPLLLE